MFQTAPQDGLSTEVKHVLLRDMALADVDLYNPDLFVRGVPHDAFRTLRLESPVHFMREPDGPGFWAVTKYHDLVTISKDPGRFSSFRGGTNIQDYPKEELGLI